MLTCRGHSTVTGTLNPDKIPAQINQWPGPSFQYPAVGEAGGVYSRYSNGRQQGRYALKALGDQDEESRLDLGAFHRYDWGGANSMLHGEVL